IAGAARALEQNGFDYPFAPVADLIRAADIGFGNLEMPICSNPARPYFPEVCPDFYSPVQTAEALKFAGFDVLNLANNHIMDWGWDALEETLSRLYGLGMQTIGAGINLSAARQPAILTCNNLRVGFLGYGVRGLWNASETSPGTAPLDRNLILEDVSLLRPNVDLLVVSLHTGILSDYPNPEDRQLANDLVRNGVNLILGHGPHVIQGIELVQGNAIYYSLGNFMIDLASGNAENKVALQENVESFIADATLRPGEKVEARVIPLFITPQFQAIPAEGECADRIQKKVIRLSQHLSKMKGLALWEHAGALNVEHELRVLAFQGRAVSWRLVLRRLLKIRWRHVRLLIGYIVSKVRHVFASKRSKESSV
ncbi:MAG TPA: CapA family protein, partial [Gammaproteobacteria bacterium]